MWPAACVATASFVVTTAQTVVDRPVDARRLRDALRRFPLSSSSWPLLILVPCAVVPLGVVFFIYRLLAVFRPGKADPACIRTVARHLENCWDELSDRPRPGERHWQDAVSEIGAALNHERRRVRALLEDPKPIAHAWTRWTTRARRRRDARVVACLTRGRGRRRLLTRAWCRWQDRRMAKLDQHQMAVFADLRWRRQSCARVVGVFRADRPTAAECRA
jgi:hypothetical protein